MPSTFDTCFSCGRCFNSCECYGKRYIPKVKKEDMKSVVKQKSFEAKQLEFPVLMQCPNTGLVVLFTETNVGTVVSSHSPTHTLGSHATDWEGCDDHVGWKPFEGTIELYN